MWTDQLEEQVLRTDSDSERKKLQAFLSGQGLALDKDIEYSVAVMDGGRIAAAGSFSGKVLKCIAVGEEYKSQGLAARVVNHLVHEQYRRCRTHLFIFTKPCNNAIFADLGFHPIAEVPSRVILMENRKDGLSGYLNGILQESEGTADSSSSAAIVVNCNPFTWGHRRLIEYAALKVAKLHVFVVSEDRSVFPSEVRYRLVKEGTRYIPNVVLHKGGDYMISDATFPSYFIKKVEDITDTHARLDLTLFNQHIAPKLNIKKRFVGEEPFCRLTLAYNGIMKEMLPASGIEVEEVPRFTSGGEAICASGVRELIRLNRMDEVKTLVPETTFRFIVSPEAETIIRTIQRG